jgi:hypothetical protein
VPDELESRVGFEIELLALRGATRADLSHAVAAAVGGEVTLAFHRDSEPSAVPGMGPFHHLTREGGIGARTDISQCPLAPLSSRSPTHERDADST